MKYIRKHILSYASILLLLLTTLNACHKDVNYTPQTPFSNVLILGNSITLTPPNPNVGWTGNWGLAASTADNDYVHLLTANFAKQNTSVKVTAMNISGFEYGFNTFNLDSAFSTIIKTKPDLVILRIGENVAVPFNAAVFDTKYQALINYFKVANPNVKILGAGSFWGGKETVDTEMRKYSPFVSLSSLSADITTEAWGLFTNVGIEQHPSDKGMSEIAQTIWTSVLRLE